MLEAMLAPKIAIARDVFFSKANFLFAPIINNQDSFVGNQKVTIDEILVSPDGLIPPTITGGHKAGTPDGVPVSPGFYSVKQLTGPVAINHISDSLDTNSYAVSLKENDLKAPHFI